MIRVITPSLGVLVRMKVKTLLICQRTVVRFKSSKNYLTSIIYWRRMIPCLHLVQYQQSTLLTLYNLKLTLT